METQSSFGVLMGIVFLLLSRRLLAVGIQHSTAPPSSTTAHALRIIFFALRGETAIVIRPGRRGRGSRDICGIGKCRMLCQSTARHVRRNDIRQKQMDLACVFCSQSKTLIAVSHDEHVVARAFDYLGRITSLEKLRRSGTGGARSIQLAVAAEVLKPEIRLQRDVLARIQFSRI